MDFSNNRRPDPSMHQVHMSRDGECVSGYFFTPVLRLYWPAQGKDLVLEGSTIQTVGREKFSLLDFSDTPWHLYLSRHHGAFVCKIPQWYYKDYHATNPPFINGVQVKPGSATLLNPGDVIRFTAMSDEFIFDPPQE